MRILLAGPPKTGNVWVEQILASVYGLRRLNDVPKLVAGLDGLRAWLAAGGFPDGAICHQHYPFSAELLDLAESVPFRLVTVLRDPYDTFVSLYFYVQEFRDTFAPQSPARAMIDKPIDHPDVLHFLANGYRQQLAGGAAWLQSGRSVVVRYEDLHRDPLATAKELTDRIKPVWWWRLKRAVGAADARKMKRQNVWMDKHIRSGTVGDSRNHLTEAHLAVFRDCHADLVAQLGYDLR